MKGVGNIMELAERGREVGGSDISIRLNIH